MGIILSMFAYKPIYRLKEFNFIFKLLQVKTSWGELSSEWGELSSEYGASCLLNVGRVVLGRVFFGASCLWGELSLGRVVLIPAVYGQLLLLPSRTLVNSYFSKIIIALVTN